MYSVCNEYIHDHNYYGYMVVFRFFTTGYPEVVYMENIIYTHQRIIFIFFAALQNLILVDV